MEQGQVEAEPGGVNADGDGSVRPGMKVELQPPWIPETTAIIPTCDNYDQLRFCLSSLLMHTQGVPFEPTSWDGLRTMPPLFAVVVNNGVPSGITRNLSAHPFYQVAEAGGNKGWEGGLALGLAVEPKSPLVLLCNDDIHVPPGDMTWLGKMVQTLRDHPDVAAVGPKSNFVMHHQHIHACGADGRLLPPVVLETKLLIGFCVLVRRDALESVGGVTQGLPGGDDFDLSLRLTAAGWRLAIQGDVYVHHWGCQTGARLFPQRWNSREMIEDTRDEIIRRHRLRPYLAMMNFKPVPLV